MEFDHYSPPVCSTLGLPRTSVLALPHWLSGLIGGRGGACLKHLAQQEVQQNADVADSMTSIQSVMQCQRRLQGLDGPTMAGFYLEARDLSVVLPWASGVTHPSRASLGSFNKAGQNLPLPSHLHCIIPPSTSNFFYKRATFLSTKTSTPHISPYSAVPTKANQSPRKTRNAPQKNHSTGYTPHRPLPCRAK